MAEAHDNEPGVTLDIARTLAKLKTVIAHRSADECSDAALEAVCAALDIDPVFVGDAD